MIWLMITGLIVFVGYSVTAFIESIGNERQRRAHERWKREHPEN